MHPKADREQLEAELSSVRNRELNLEAELAAVRRALSCAKTDASLLRTKLEALPQSAPAQAPFQGRTAEVGTGMASRSAPCGGHRQTADQAQHVAMDDWRHVESSAWDVSSRLAAQPLLYPDPCAVDKPSPKVVAAATFEPFKRKLSEDQNAMPLPAENDYFPDTQEDEQPEAKCPRLSKPTSPAGFAAVSSHTPEPKRPDPVTTPEPRRPDPVTTPEPKRPDPVTTPFHKPEIEARMPGNFQMQAQSPNLLMLQGQSKNSTARMSTHAAAANVSRQGFLRMV